MPFTKHSIKHPQQADVFEQVGYTGCGFSIQFPIADNPACSVEALLDVSLDYLSNKKKLSKDEKQVVKLLTEANAILQKTTPVEAPVETPVVNE